MSWREISREARSRFSPEVIDVKYIDGHYVAIPPDFYLCVPCGKCAECYKRRRKEWSLRLMRELLHGDVRQKSFFTLTFSDDFYDDTLETAKKYFMRFLDRVRKELGYRPRYWFITERGKKGTKRIHFHGVFFDVSQQDLRRVSDKWQYGFTYVGYVTSKTMNYITKYMLKGSMDIDNYEKALLLCSRGVGRPEDFETASARSEFINGFDPIFYIDVLDQRYPMPRYFSDRLFSREVKDVFIENRCRDGDEIWKRACTWRGIVYPTPRQAAEARDRDYKESIRLGLSHPVNRPVNKPFEVKLDDILILFNL